MRASFSSVPPIDFRTSPSLPASTASGLRAALMIASRPFCQMVSSHRLTERLSSSCSLIASTRSRVSGRVWRSLASWASASSTLIRTGCAGSVDISTVSLRRPSMIASASLASSPASFSTQLAFLCTISRISGSLASSARAVQRIAASSIGTWRSSLIAEASAWPSSGETSVLRSRAAIAPLTMPPRRSSSRLSKMSAISRDAPARIRVPSPGGRLEEAAGRAGDVEPLHPPRDHRRDQEILLEEAGERLADPVLVARDDRGVRDRQAERMAEQGGDREPVGEAADHRRLGEGLDVAEPRDSAARTRARRRTPRPSRPAGRSRRPSCPARPAAPG